MNERPHRSGLKASIREDVYSDADSEGSSDNDPWLSQQHVDDDEYRPSQRSSGSRRRALPSQSLPVLQARTLPSSPCHSSEGYEEGILGEGEEALLGPSQERAREKQRQIQLRIEERLAAHEDAFWADRMDAIERMTPECIITNTRRPPLPPARIRKYLKEETSLVCTPEVTHFMVAACELLILDLTTRAWACAEESRRKGVQRCDIARGISVSDTFDFIIDIVPREYMHIKSRRGLRPMMPYLIPIHAQPRAAAMSMDNQAQPTGVQALDEYGGSGRASAAAVLPPPRPLTAMSQASHGGGEADGLFLLGDDIEDGDMSCLDDMIILSQNHRPGPFRAHPSADAARSHVRAHAPERRMVYEPDVWTDKARGRHSERAGVEAAGGIFDDSGEGEQQGGFVLLGGPHV